jgi:hypothetical protein
MESILWRKAFDVYKSRCILKAYVNLIIFSQLIKNFTEIVDKIDVFHRNIIADEIIRPKPPTSLPI